MEAVFIKTALVGSAMLIGTASLAQPNPATPDIPQDICRRLEAFLNERGGRVPAATAPITIEEVRRFDREGNRFACHSAISGMYTTGVALPAPLLDAIGVPTDISTGAGPRR